MSLFCVNSGVCPWENKHNSSCIEHEKLVELLVRDNHVWLKWERSKRFLLERLHLALDALRTQSPPDNTGYEPSRARCRNSINPQEATTRGQTCNTLELNFHSEKFILECANLRHVAFHLRFVGQYVKLGQQSNPTARWVPSDGCSTSKTWPRGNKSSWHRPWHDVRWCHLKLIRYSICVPNSLIEMHNSNKSVQNETIISSKKKKKWKHKKC